MITTQAFVSTEHADRYLARLSRHASQMQRHFGQREERQEPHQPPSVEDVDASGDEATLSFTGGRCLISAQPQGLKLRLEAEDEKNLRRLQDGVGRRLQTLGTKDRLRVVWSFPEITQD